MSGRIEAPAGQTRFYRGLGVCGSFLSGADLGTSHETLYFVLRPPDRQPLSGDILLRTPLTGRAGHQRRFHRDQRGCLNMVELKGQRSQDGSVPLIRFFPSNHASHLTNLVLLLRRWLFMLIARFSTRLSPAVPGLLQSASLGGFASV